MRVFLLCAALTSFGCGSFGSQHGTWNASKQDSTASGKETFDLKASVSAPTDFEVKGSTITWRLPNGSPPPRDMGSAYTAPLPRHPAEELDVKQVAGRGQFKLVERPTAANDWTLRVALGAPDSSGQEYHLQFSWKSDGATIVSAISPILLERCQREVQMAFQERYPQAAFAWEEHTAESAGVLVYLKGQATAATDESHRVHVSWECFVDPRHNTVPKKSYKILEDEQAPAGEEPSDDETP